MAERERAEARLHEERARSHELGLNDDELMPEERATRTRESTVTDEARADGVPADNGTEREAAVEEAPAGGRIQNGDR